MPKSASHPAIRITNLTKSFTRRSPGRERVIPVDNVSIEITTDELVVLLGPSGCGKTTLLRCVAGLEVPDSGEIVLDGRVVFSSDKGIFVPPEERGVSMIFQSYALWPHMTIHENVAFPLRAKHVAKATIDQRVVETLEVVGLGQLGSSYPGQISGGQQQRVALARAIVGQERVVLFDEPLSNVDAKVRERLRVELLDIKRRAGFSALYVTHDQTEAMELANRIAVLANGKVSQYDTPRAIYDRPSNEYVGNFIGSANTLRGRLLDRGEHKDNGQANFESELGPVTATCASSAISSARSVERVLLSRPEKWSLGTAQAELNSWQGVVDSILFSGAYTDYRVRVKDQLVQILSPHADLAAVNQQIWVSISPKDLLAIPVDQAVAAAS